MRCHEDLKIELVLGCLARWKGTRPASLILENSRHLPVDLWVVYFPNGDLYLTVGQGRVIIDYAEEAF